MRGVLIGRFQPFHGGHLEVVRHVRSERPPEGLVLGIGSAQESYTEANPFTAGERFEAIERALDEAGITGCAIVPIPDIQRHAEWVAYVAALLPPFERVYTNNPLTRLLFERAGYAVESPPLYDRGRYEGVAIRRLLASGGDWKRAVPPAVAAYLEGIDAPGRLRLLAGRGDRPAPSAGRP
ncbi:MAG TPA: nicotinamide-nucleotide adenylyltransferase [Thermoplasmata archaeon]|nr:nicotinamide-nucleotide adenylyltransferase [Thermoplasmata archaeon]